jgi:hypothetical protein
MKNRARVGQANNECLNAAPSHPGGRLRAPKGNLRTAALFGVTVILFLGVPTICLAQMMGGGGGGAMGGGGSAMGASAGAVGPGAVGLDSGPSAGMEVEGRIYPAGAAVPSGAPLVITVKLGDTQRQLTLATRPMANRSGDGRNRDEFESLGGNEREFYRVMARKTVRVATDSLVRSQLARLDQQESPLEIRGWVSGSASPILTLDYVGAVADDSPDGASTAAASHRGAAVAR